jgi:hypothetical protein
MKRMTALRIVGSLVLCLGFLPALVRAERPPCLPTSIAAGQRTVTPAEVIGASQERLTLGGHHPEDTRGFEQSQPDNGYLITGDKVDLITTCDGYAYVRFHGSKRVSTGWVQETRIKTIGPAHSTLPSNAVALCKAAEDIRNRGEPLVSPPTVALDDKVLESVHLEQGWNASPAQVAHVVVDGRRLATVVVDSGGTSHDTSVYVLSDDLKNLLSPADRDDRDVENQGADTWGFGVSEDMVTVLGQPMVGSEDRRDAQAPAYLSIIDRDGDIVPTCEMANEALKVREIVSSTDDSTCHATLAGRQLPLPMHKPLPAESLMLGTVPTEYSSESDNGAPSHVTLHYHNSERASEVTYSLASTGIADLDNSGKQRHIGLVFFSDGDSTAGDGTYSDTQVVPVYLDKSGAADPSANANQKMAAALPHGMRDGRLITLDGAPYLELSPEQNGRSSEVWKIDPNGAHKVCGFKLTHEVVRPISE